MTFDCDPAQRPLDAESGNANGYSNGHTEPAALPNCLTHRLRLNPKTDHEPDNYEDLELDFSPLIFRSLERYLPPNLINQERNVKVDFMREILLRYYPESERIRAEKLREYRRKIISNYQRLHEDLYSMNAEKFFTPSFLRAISENTEQGFRGIMSEPHPGVFTFQIFNQQFCEMMIAEVENFERWLTETKFRIMKPNKLSKHGVVLDDFGLESMLDRLVKDYIRPIAKFFFPDVGGATLDTHHGFVLRFGDNKVALHFGDNKEFDVPFHVDDSEVTLNVCLGSRFLSGGELCFRGSRCKDHFDSDAQLDEVFDYQHVLGNAILHRSSIRHCARATTSGSRINLVLWCRSTAFRQLITNQTDFADWCAECRRKKEERQRQAIAAAKLELLRKDQE